MLLITVFSVFSNSLIWKDYYREWNTAIESDLKVEDVLPKLKKYNDGTAEELPEVAENDEEYHKSHKVIAVNGYWYNVAGFLKFHPGGPVIEKFVGADITSTFYGIHRNPDDILKNRKPVARVKLDKDGLRNAKENRDYWLLYQRYKALGLFEPNMTWLKLD
jgi:cytochrome b involved in lipid metabolism